MISPENPARQIALVKRYLPFAAAAFAVVGGGLSMAGWITHSPRLIDWNGDGITIKFNPSVAITAAGVALFLMALSPRLKIPAVIFATIPALLGFLTLLQHIFGVNFGIDTYFFSEAPGARATSAPGRMGVPASTTLTLIGIAVILLATHKHRRLASILGAGTFVVAALALVGYFFGASELYSWPRLTGIALQAASMIAALGIGVIASVPEWGLMAVATRVDAGGKAFRTLLLPLILILMILAWLRVMGQEQGYYDTAFGTAALTLIEVVFIIGLLWWTANIVSREEARRIETERIWGEIETHRRISTVQEAERRRLSRDLHDHTGQQLTGLRLKLENVKESIEKHAPQLTPKLQDLCEEALRMDRDISLLAWELRPESLDEHGLADTLASFVREWSLTHGVNAEFHAIEANIRMRPEVETNLYRIVQEALNNILKYANATDVTVTLDCTGSQAKVVIEDNGIGFNPDEFGPEHNSGGGGLGLIGMQERAALLGGRVEIESSPGKGTSVFARVPATC